VSIASIQLLIRHGQKLQGLGLSFCSQLTDNSLANLAQITGLKAIQLESCANITDKSIEDVGSESLVQINMRNCSRITGSSIHKILKRSPNVTSLNLSRTSLTAEQFSHLIPQFHQIKTLDISGINTPFDLSQLSRHLTSLRVDECPSVSDLGVQKILETLQQLQHLSVCFCRQLTDASFATLCKKNSSLTYIGIGGCGNFTDKTIERISTYCPRLKEMVVPWNKELTDKSLICLTEGCKNLRTLNVAYCNRISDYGVKSVLSGCKNLKKLDLGYCPLITGAFLSLALSLFFFCVVVHFFFSCATVTGLLSVVKDCKALNSLRVKQHYPGVISEFFIEQMSKYCPNLNIETSS
jgi:F-box/leucine-rich repeat protein 2/20